MKVIAVDLKGAPPFMEDTYHLHPDGHQVSVRTSSKSVSRLRTASLHRKSIRSGSAARKTRCASCSMLPLEVQSNASIISTGVNALTGDLRVLCPAQQPC